MEKIILVIDDDKINLRMAEKMLNQEFDIRTALSWEQAVGVLDEVIPDLILLDLVMPQPDGFEVMRRLKDDLRWNKIPVIVLSASRDSETEAECLKTGAVDFVGKPFEPEIMRNRIRRTLEMEEYRQGLEIVVRKQTAKIERLQTEVIISLANLIESRDGSTGQHVKRTSQYVELMVTELKRRNLYSDIIDEEFLYNLEKAAPMHDIGKIKIPDQVLQKPGRLTEEEFEVMKQHSMEGGNIIRKIMLEIEEKDYIEVAYNVATYHHEKWNGQGYPSGLSGEQIPLEARIMAVADVFDALISKRCYKEAMPLEDAFKIIEESKGEHFDPQIAQIFLELRPQIERYLQAW